MGFVLQDLSFSRGQRPVLGPLSTALEGRELVGVVGPNGCGKSTLLRLLYGYLEPVSGKVLLDDVGLQEISARELASRMGVCPQEPEATLDFSVEQALALALGGEPSDLPEQLSPLAFLGLEEMLSRRLSELSGGEKQKVRLARALLTRPPWLLLDEPANHLDLCTTWSLMDYLGATRDGGVLVALHDLHLAVRFCHRLVLLHQGRLVEQGPVEQVLTEENLVEVFGLRGCLIQESGRRPRLELEGPARG